MSSSPAPGSFSLFPSPNTSKPPPVVRNQTPRGRRSGSIERRVPTPQGRRAATPLGDESSAAAVPTTASPPRNSPPRNRQPTPQQYAVRMSPEFETATGPVPRSFDPASRRQQAQAISEVTLPPRIDTNVAVQASVPPAVAQNQARNSIAKPPLTDIDTSQPEQPLRSIFPTYNPDVPLHQQNYAPAQIGPARIPPRAIVSRQSYRHRETPEDAEVTQSPMGSPRGGYDEPSQYPHNRQPRAVPSEPPPAPKTSTTEQLKTFWKSANGWRAASSEGGVYCLKLSQDKDAPVYTLSSATEPFYNVRLDPTSASAYVTVMRHDPNKPYKEPKPDGATSSASSSSGALSPRGKITDGKHWHEAMSTVLEEESRRHPPQDGLVSLLMPSAATKMATQKANDAHAVALAEMECARLVWDDDSRSHFLVHPALATPFCVTIDRCPAWSRVEYTLEHHESPRHLAKLTRDGSGGGWLEIDTTLAGHIEAFYVIDVAVTALLLVANIDEKNLPQGTAAAAFEPPPQPATILQPPPSLMTAADKAMNRFSMHTKGKKSKSSKSSKSPMHAFEVDVESQDGGSLGKHGKKVKEGIDKLPFALRVPLKIAKGMFKAFIWVLTVAFKCLRVMFTPCYRLVGSKY